MKNTCSVPGCENRSRDTKIHRFAHPGNYERYQRWIEVIKNKELERMPAEAVYNYYLVCRDHFEPHHYTRNGRLYPFSVPTLNLPISGITFSLSNCAIVWLQFVKVVVY